MKFQTRVKTSPIICNACLYALRVYNVFIFGNIYFLYQIYVLFIWMICIVFWTRLCRLFSNCCKIPTSYCLQSGDVFMSCSVCLQTSDMCSRNAFKEEVTRGKFYYIYSYLSFSLEGESRKRKSVPLSLPCITYSKISHSPEDWIDADLNSIKCYDV